MLFGVDSMISFVSLLLFSSCANKQEKSLVHWKSKAAGVWTVKAGSPDELNLTSELQVSPKWKTINAMGEASLPIAKEDIKFEFIDGKTYLRFPLAKGEKIYGLGLNFKTVEQRGRIMRLHVDHYGGRDNGRTHAPVPFFVSSRGYGAFINSARYLDVYVGTGVRVDSKVPVNDADRNTDRSWSAQPYSDQLDILIPTTGVDLVLFAGKNMLDVVRRFNLYNGGGTLPPKWGLGFWQRTPTLYSDKDVLNEVAEFKKRGFPLSVIGLEPGWMSRSYPCTYEWDKSRFPNPEKLVQALNAEHVKTNLWMNEGVSPRSELASKLKPLSCSHTIWNGLIPDYTLPKAVSLVKELMLKEHLSIGVSGYKMDENDGFDNWIFPDVATFPSGHSAEQMRQIYGSLMQQFTTKMYRDQNKRTYGLVRSSNGGASSFPYVIYNDYYKHRDFITALINSSFIGVLWTPEVRASSSSEEWLRRMQTVCFSPLAMLNAWADGTKPWTFKDVADDVNQIALLRMQLIPYLYTAFSEYTFQGIPPMRAMNLEPAFTAETSTQQSGALDGTKNPYALATKREMKDQFMVGKDLLVAPLFAGEKERKVILPQGKWYDFYTGDYVGEGEVIIAVPGLSKIPVYVRNGGIVPLLPKLVTLDGTKQALEIRHYGTKSGSFKLYDDDGESYDYEKGQYMYLDIQVSVDAQGNKKGLVTLPDNQKSWSYNGVYNFHYMTK